MKKIKCNGSPLSPSSRRYFPYSGFIIVYLEIDYKEDNIFDIPYHPKGFNLDLEVKPCSITRLVNNISITDLKALEVIAEKSKFPPIRSLSRYWRLDYRNADFPLEKIVDKLNQTKGVDIAYQELLVSDCNQDSEVIYDNEYLNSAILGIDAKSAWCKCYEGQGVGLIDIEQGWDLKHQELNHINSCENVIVNHNAHSVSYIDEDGDSVLYLGNHGTNVLGVIVAKDDEKGLKGIAPAVEYVRLASHYNRVVNASGRIVEAIIGTISKMFCSTVKSGDIILIETQKIFSQEKKLPVEIELANFDAIRLASALGFIVIEAAGNGKENLDNIYNETIKADSGAILVAAAKPEINGDKIFYVKRKSSNYGKRIDCFAPVHGNDVFSVPTGLSSLGDQNQTSNRFTSNFGGTSLTSAIIAGAAILVQSAYKENDYTLSSLQMRYLLSNSNFGVQSYVSYSISSDSYSSEGEVDASDINDGGPYCIGLMPDLKKIVGEGLWKIPDIYIRKDSEDSGSLPYEKDVIDKSPDIVVRKSDSISNPFRDIDIDQNAVILEGIEEHCIYIRLGNRSEVEAMNVSVDVYFADNLSFGSLKKVGSFPDRVNQRQDERVAARTTGVNVSQTISNYESNSHPLKIRWKSDAIPILIERVSYYLVVIARQEECDSLIFPIKSENNEIDFEDVLNSKPIFEQFIRNNNNVACLKFTIPSDI